MLAEERGSRIRLDLCACNFGELQGLVFSGHSVDHLFEGISSLFFVLRELLDGFPSVTIPKVSVPLRHLDVGVSGKRLDEADRNTPLDKPGTEGVPENRADEECPKGICSIRWL